MSETAKGSICTPETLGDPAPLGGGEGHSSVENA